MELTYLKLLVFYQICLTNLRIDANRPEHILLLLGVAAIIILFITRHLHLYQWELAEAIFHSFQNLNRYIVDNISDINISDSDILRC